MPAERYFYPNPIVQAQKITLDGEEFHHLARVCRARAGDLVEIVNGTGQLAKAKIEQIEKKQAVLHISEITQLQTDPPLLILAQGIPRMNHLELILEKGTELGMSEIWIFPARRSERKVFSENQMQRMRTILISAMKQCGRLHLPKLKLMGPIKDWPSIEMSGYYGDTSPNAPWLIDELQQLVLKKGVFFCVGPESGFTDEEHLELQDHGLTGVKLNENILRTETAAIASLSLISQFLSRKNG